MNIISLGGVGGCDLAYSLRDLNQPTGPYDWIIATQSFVIDSFDNYNNFFDFDEKYVYDTSLLLTDNKKAIILHDFTDFATQKQQVIEKYKRRYERLHSALNSTNPVLLVRIWDNLNETISPYYSTIFAREQEQLELWNDWIKHKTKSFPTTRLLIITSDNSIYDQAQTLDLTVEYTPDVKQHSNITNIIRLYT